MMMTKTASRVDMAAVLADPAARADMLGRATACIVDATRDEDADVRVVPEADVYNSERSMATHKAIQDDAISRAAQVIGRLGGLAGTSAQQRARRANAQLAGRPGRTCRTCGKLIQAARIASHDKCGLWTWEPAKRKTRGKRG